MSEKLTFVIEAKDQFSKTMGSLRSALPSIKQLAVGAAVGAAALGAGLLAAAASTAKTHDEIRKLSDQLEVSTEFLSKMRVASEFAGVGAKLMDKSIQKLQVSIGEAGDGMATYKDSFDALGVSIRKSNGELKNSEEIMPELADAFNNMSNATEKAAAASALFGTRGLAMLQVFKDGKDGLEAMWMEAEKFGLVVSEDAANAAAEFNDSMTRLTGSFTGLKNKVGEEVMPIFTALANQFADFVAEHREGFTEFLKNTVTGLLEFVNNWLEGVNQIHSAWVTFTDSFGNAMVAFVEIFRLAFAEIGIVVLDGVDFIIEKVSTLMEALNFGGVLDEQLASLSSLREGLDGVGESLAGTSAEAQAVLSNLADIEAPAPLFEGFKLTQEEAKRTTEVVAEENQKQMALFQSSRDDLIKELEAARETEHIAQTTELERLEEWYVAQQEIFAGHSEEMAALQELHEIRKTEIETAAALERADQQEEIDKAKAARDKQDAANQKAGFSQLQDDLLTIAGAGSKTAFALWKASALAQALISIPSSAQKAFDAMVGVPFVGPALAVAAAAASVIAGGIRVAQIKAQKMPAAHGGLTNVPREQTFLLDQNERVLSPNQNADLTEFLAGQGGGGGEGGEINIAVSILPNATHFEALMQMSREDIDEWVESVLLPSFRRLDQAGVITGAI